MRKWMITAVLALVSIVGTAQNLRANLDESVRPGDAFGIQPTDKMFIPKEKRALIW